nr:uncharacterized protein LOC123772893 isoform X5 [Procambarus clarkii]
MSCHSYKEVSKVKMCAPRRMAPTWFTLVVLWFTTPLVLAAVAPLDIEVTIPPLLEAQPPKEEVLFTVNHDPDQAPEPFTLPCRADALPEPSYYWLKDGDKLDLQDGEEERGRVEMIEGEGSLIFHDPRPEDEGSYQCIAENSVGVAHSEVATVRRSVMGNFPKAEPRVVTATLGQSLSLPCTPPDGYPEPSVHWVIQTSDGGLRSLNSPRLTVDEQGTLWFSYVTPEDASEDTLYACAASSATSGRQMYLVEDEEGRLQVVDELPVTDIVTSLTLPTEYRMGNWVYLNVSFPGDDKTTLPEQHLPPVLQYVSDREVTALEGDEVKLYCVFGGYPVPEVRWWRESRADVETNKLEHFGKTLVLDDVSEADMGSYSCQATNDAGESETQHFTVYIESAPEFVVEPEVTNLPQGETAVFNCEASGDPEPTITWTKNGDPMESHDTTVMFDALALDMKATIACNASNKHGYVYKSVYLNVLSLPPEWLTEPQDVVVLEGLAATLHCEAYGSPDPNMTWVRIDGDERVVIHDEDPRYHVDDTKLVIRAVDKDTEGHYICIATNKFASLESQVHVDVREKTEAEASLVAERVEAGDHVSLDCRIKIDPHLNPTVTWFKDDVQLDLEDDNFHLGRREDFHSDESGHHDSTDDHDDGDDDDDRQEETWVLEIMKVHGDDSGVYTCRVHTSLDDVSDDLILTVEDVPNPPHLTTGRCGAREAFLEWSSAGDNNAPLQGFVIQYVTPFHPDQWKDARNKIPASSTSFSVDMSPGLNYTFRVLAFNRVGMSRPSDDTAQCYPPGLPPDHHPNNVSVTGTAPGTLLVSWEVIPPEEHNGPDFHYKVLWRAADDTKDDHGAGDDDEDDDTAITHAEDDANDDTTEGDDDIEHEDDNQTWHSIKFDDWERSEAEIADLPPYQEYKVKVEARNAYGPAQVPLLVLTGHSGQDVPKNEPDGLQAADTDATDVVLTWNPVDEDSVNGLLLGYKVEYWEDDDGDADDDDDDEVLQQVLTTGPVGRAELTGLKPFREYRARVSAVNSAFSGPTSATISFKTAEGESGPVSNLKAKQLSDDSLLVNWEEPEEPHGVVKGYEVHYTTLREDGQEGPVTQYDERLPPSVTLVKLSDLEPSSTIRVTVSAVNAAGHGEGSSVEVELEEAEPLVPAVPVFTWSIFKEGEAERGVDTDADGDVDDADLRNKNVILGDTDGDGDIDRDDVLDTDNDGDIDEDDVGVADINNDGVIDEEDVKAADRDDDGDVDIADIGDEDGDGDFDGSDVLAADDDADGDIDASDEDEENTLLEDRDEDGDIDKDDVVDINHDGIVDDEDFRAADVDNDGDIDEDDVKAVDKDGDGDIDAADLTDLDGDGRVDGDDLEVMDRDGDGDVDATDYILRRTFLTDVDKDGDIDVNDVLDTDNDGDIDADDRAVADIDNDGDVDSDDVEAGDRDGDGDIDAADIGDEDGDGDIDGQDVLKADEDGDGDIDASDDNEEDSLLEDRDGDGDVDRSDVIDLDGDGDIDSEDFAAADIDDDGDVDMDDVKVADKDGDGDIDAADVTDLDGDGKVDGDDLEFEDRDNDGDIDAKDFTFRNTLLADTDGDGDVDQDDVLDVDGDGDIDGEDIKASDIDDDGDVDMDDVKRGDKDGDNDVDSSDVRDIDGDGFVDEDDLDVVDRDADGDIDVTDFDLRKTILGDTDGDGDVDKADVLDTDGDGDIDQEDIDVADIDNDGDVDISDVRAADRDHDGDIDEADIGDEDGDGDIDGDDVIAADEDGDGDIDAADDDGESILLSDSDRDGDIDRDDVTDLDGDGDVDESDHNAADVDNDGDVDADDLRAADRDGDADVDAADIVDVDGDGDIDGKDLIAADKDGDGDIDTSDIQNLDVFLKDTDHDGDVDRDDVLDTDHDGDVDDDDVSVADIDNDGDIDSDDIIAADRDGDGDVDFKDIGDEDGDGDIDGSDILAADKDGDGDIDAADEGRGVDIRVDWRPNFDEHPGVDFYVQNRVKGTEHWKSSPVERANLHQTISGLDPRRTYEIRMVAKDGDLETPSEIVIIPSSEEQGGKLTAITECTDVEGPAGDSVYCVVHITQPAEQVDSPPQPEDHPSPPLYHPDHLETIPVDETSLSETLESLDGTPSHSDAAPKRNGGYTMAEDNIALAEVNLTAEDYDYDYTSEDHYPTGIDGTNILDYWQYGSHPGAHEPQAPRPGHAGDVHRDRNLTSTEDSENDLVPLEDKDDLVPVEDREDDLVPVEDREDDLVPLEDREDDLVPLEDREDDLVPLEDREDDLVPVEDREDDLVPVEDREDDLVPLEDREDDLVPLEDREDDLVPLEDREDDLVPLEDREDDLVPLEDREDDLVPLEDREDDLVPLDDREDGLVPVEDREDDLVPVEDREDDLVPVEDREDDLVPVEDREDDLVPVEDSEDDLVPLEDGEDDLVPLEDGEDDLVPVEDSEDDLVPVEDSEDDLVPLEDRENDLVPVEDREDDLVPVEDREDDLVTVEDSEDDLVPVEDREDDLVTVEDREDDLVLLEDREDDLAPLEDRDSDLDRVEDRDLSTVEDVDGELYIPVEDSDESFASVKGDSDVPVESGDGGSPVESGDGESPVESGDGGSPVESGDGDAQVESGDGGSPVESGDGDAQVESGDSEVPVESGDSDSPVESGDVLVGSGDSDSPVESGDGDSPVESGDSDSPVESGDSDSPVERGDSDSPVESGDSDSPIESGDGDVLVGSGDSDSPVERGDSEVPVESGDSDSPVERGDSDSPIESGDSEVPVESGDSEVPVESGDGEAQVEDSDEGYASIDSDDGATPVDGADSGVSPEDSDGDIYAPLEDSDDSLVPLEGSGVEVLAPGGGSDGDATSTRPCSNDDYYTGDGEDHMTTVNSDENDSHTSDDGDTDRPPVKGCANEDYYDTESPDGTQLDLTTSDETNLTEAKLDDEGVRVSSETTAPGEGSDDDGYFPRTDSASEEVQPAEDTETHLSSTDQEPQLVDGEIRDYTEEADDPYFAIDTMGEEQPSGGADDGSKTSSSVEDEEVLPVFGKDDESYDFGVGVQHYTTLEPLHEYTDSQPAPASPHDDDISENSKIYPVKIGEESVATGATAEEEGEYRDPSEGLNFTTPLPDVPRQVPGAASADVKLPLPDFEEPTVGAVMEETNPILWTWFIIAVMVAVTMICIVFFSMWVYSQRLARVAELRAALYEGYEPAQPEPVKKEIDVEAAKLPPTQEDAVEDEMTANYQRKENRRSWYHVQLAAMMKRQETVQSVDSFASHDDDFAEYGDESMGRFTDDGSLIYQKV